MNKVILAFSFWLCCVISAAQISYTIKPVNSLNTPKDDIACSMINDKLILMTTGEVNLVNEYSWNAHPVFYLNEATRGKDFSEWSNKTKLFSYPLRFDEGPGSFDYRDSTIYFSTCEQYGKVKGNRLRIYTSRLTVTGWTEPQILPFCNWEEDYTHPHFDPTNNVLLFSSNRQGGIGQMDIWYVYKTDTGWGEPMNLGLQTNTTSNELFPTIFDGDIYYSSNAQGGKGGYDLIKANGKEQWKTTVRLEEPFNGAKDDMVLLFLNNEKALLTSNRSGGAGGDDIYLIEKNPEDFEKHDFTASIECNGVPQQNVRVTAANAWKEIVMDGTTDASGNLDIKPLRINQNYKIQLHGIDPSLYANCVLIIRDEIGNIVKEIRFNSFGFATLEMLPFSYTNLNLLAAEDGTMLMPEEVTSLLNVKIEGQLYDKTPGDVGRGEPITILDEKGIPAAIAFTNETGKFRFTNVKPEMDYSFKLAEESRVKNILIMDKGERITLPILNAEAHYHRINPEEAIQLVNEFNEKIYVSAKDIFVINRIYYNYNSAQLTEQSSMQLDKLEILVKKNDKVKLEMRSHTDSRGSADYNNSLSKKRAESAVSYLSSKGISRARFVTNGFGENQLLNECGDGTPCSEPEHSINRRTEIRLFED